MYKRHISLLMIAILATSILIQGCSSPESENTTITDQTNAQEETGTESTDEDVVEDERILEDTDFEDYEEAKDSESEDTIIRDETLNGRGKSEDGSRSEPQYENHIGYVAINSDTELKKSDSFVNTPWTVPIYEEDKQFYNEIGTLDHKTEVLVITQDLKHEKYGNYSGKLLVESLEDGEQYIINVSNFIVKPYWTYDDLVEAASVGDFIAEFNQISDYYPVNKSNEKVELDDGIIVLVVGKTGNYSKGPDTNTNQLEGIVFKEWKNGYGGVSIFFNSDDLTLIY